MIIEDNLIEALNAVDAKVPEYVLVSRAVLERWGLTIEDLIAEGAIVKEYESGDFEEFSTSSNAVQEWE